MAEGVFDNVVEICLEALKIAKEQTDFQIMQAIALHRSGRTAEGLEALRAAIDENPNDPQLLANLGELQRQSGDIGQAIDTLRQAQSLNPKNPLIHFNLARASADAAAPTEAEAHFRAALAIDHRFMAAHRALCRLLKGAAASGGGEMDDLCLRLANLLSEGQDSADYAFNLQTVLQDVRRAMGFGSGTSDNLLVLGKLLLDLGEVGIAIEVLEKGRQLPDVHPDYDIALAMSYAADKQWRKAQETTAHFIRINPLGSRLCMDPGIDVLVLEALYNPAFEHGVSRRGFRARYGDAIFCRFGTMAEMAPRRMSFHHLYIDEIDPRDARLKSKFNVIYNNITAAEINLRRNYTPVIEEICRTTDLEIVNRCCLKSISETLRKPRMPSRLNSISRCCLEALSTTWENLYIASIISMNCMTL
jgi:tetratricopeptide (TPR) repeat protein